MLDENKICFITCVTNASYYEESVLYLEQLVIPAGMSKEYIAVENARSMSAGYNEAMEKSTAKYKIYLHQDFFLTNKRALIQLLSLFNAVPEIGMMGLAGCTKLPQNGIWWKAEECFGQLYHSYVPESICQIVYGEIKGEYVQVQALDGVFIATQYDLRWRDDLITGWHFYDIAQSMEFHRAGYSVVIPRLDFSWGIHATGDKNLDCSYIEMQKKFIQEYKQELLG